jgi:polygalacturonase
VSRIENPFITFANNIVPRSCGIALALSTVILFISPAFAQDTRTVTEPQFPAVICQTLQANLQATNGVFAGYDETAPGNSQPDTARINNAITACASSTGVSAVELQASGANNAFLAGQIILKSGVVVLVDPGVTLYASRNPRDFDSTPGSGKCGTTTNGGSGCNNFISGSSIVNAGIMGYGVIDGRGEMPMIGSTQSWWDIGETGTQSNPRMIQVTSVTNFTFYKITLQNSPKFHIYGSNSINGLTAWGIKITAPWTSANTDGFDPTGSNVTLTNSYISDGDDEVAIKGGSTVNGMTFSHNHFYSGHGMSIGSETNGNVSNVYVTDLTMAGDVNDTNNNGLRVKSDSSRGGTVQNVVYDGVCIKDTDHPLVFDTAYSSSTGSKYPYFKSITVRNTHIVDDPAFHYMSSTENVAFNGYNATYPMGVTLDNLVFDPLILAATTNNGQNDNRFFGQYVNFLVGAGPVSIAPQLPYIQPGYSNGTITITPVTPSNSNPPYDCTNKWVYLATELFASTNTITASQTLPLMVVVQPIVASDPLPNGTVTIYDNGTLFTTVPLSTTNWLTQVPLDGLSVGTHVLTAHFSGDDVVTKYAAMDFGNFTVTVGPDNAVSTTTVVTGSQNVDAGTALQLTATVNASGGIPTGTVVFLEGSTQIGTAVLDGTGKATVTVNTLNAGPHGFKANYYGDGSFAASSTAQDFPVTVTAATATALSSSGAQVNQGNPLTLTATVSSAYGTPTGTVTFYDGATSLGTDSVDSTGTASITTSSLAVGPHTLTAAYGATTFFYGSTSAGVAVSVNALTTTTLAVSPNPAISGTVVTMTATVTSGSGTPSGTVSFSDGSTSLGTAAVNAGVATFTYTFSGTGTHNLSATYAGVSGFAASGSSVVALAVNAATTTTLAASPNPVNFGSPLTLTATVAAGILTPPAGGTVTFYDGANVLGTGTLNGSGVATYTTSALSGGSHSITATYAGVSGYASSTSSSVTVAVTGGAVATTTVLTVNPATPVSFGTAITFTATVTASGGTPTGSVAFMDGVTQIGTATLDGTGKANFATSSLAGGTHNINANYAGATGFNSSASSTAVVVVNAAATTTMLVASPTTVTFGGPVTLTATVTSGAGTPSGTVTFSEGLNTLGTGTLNGSGVATYTTTSLAVGSHSLTATYAATTDYGTSMATAASVTVNAAATTTTLVASPTTVTFGGAVTLTATVASGAGTPGGTVTFSDGATSLGTGTLNGSGVATYTTTSLAVGAHSLTATYGATTNFAASTSSSATVTVNAAATPDFAITANPTVLNVAIGGSGTTTITLTPQNGFSGSVALGCGNLPAYVTCTFLPASPVAVSGNAVNVQMTVRVAATTASLQQQQMPFRLAPMAIPAMFAFVPLMILPGKKKLSAKFLVGLLLAAILLASVGCGGGGNKTPAPAPSSTITTLVVSPATPNFGNAVTLTATVTSGGGTPSGSVTFYDGSSALGTGTLNGSGVAVYSTTSLAVGSHSTKASYSGSASFGASTSSTAAVTVNPPTGGQVVSVTGTSGSTSHPLNLTINITN